MAPIETLNDEEQQYQTICCLPTEELQKIASLDLGKRGIIAKHELEVRFFNKNKELTNRSIGLARWNTFLTLVSLLLAIGMFILVWRQTDIAKEQIKIYKQQISMAPKLDLAFWIPSQPTEGEFACQLAIENLGDKAADGAKACIYLSDGDILYLNGVQIPPVSLLGTPNIYQFITNDKVIKKRNSVLGNIRIHFKNIQPYYNLQYQVVADGMSDKNGAYPIKSKFIKSV